MYDNLLGKILMHIFFEPNISSKIISLNEIESKHCIKVLRLNINDEILLLDGKGNLHTAKILNDNHKKCEVEIIKTITDYNKRDYYLHIAIAPTKNMDRFEWFLEKTTEIGIDEITPLLCARSERKIVKIERIIKVVRSAMKQAIIAKHPKVNEFTKFKDFVNSIGDNTEKYIAHCEESSKKLLQDYRLKNRSSVILIGPEGDFTDEEIKLALSNDYKEISLGQNRLRTETAGIVACSTVAFVNQNK